MIEFTVKFPIRPILRAILFFAMGWVMAVNTYSVEANHRWAVLTLIISLILNIGVLFHDHLDLFSALSE